MNHVFQAMGTVVSVGPDLPGQVCAQVQAVFARWEARFSLYLPGSELSALARGDITLPQASPELQHSYDLALEFSDLTNGAFTPHRPDGVIDLAGVVKAQAISEAAGVLRAAGYDYWSINAGGDVLTSTGPSVETEPVGQGAAESSPWIVGIVDPLAPKAPPPARPHTASATMPGAVPAGASATSPNTVPANQPLLATFRTRPGLVAVATSGVAERGDHIWTLGRPGAFAQVSVAAADIVLADVLATAICAGGKDTMHQATAQWPIAVLTVEKSGQIWATPEFYNSTP